MEAAGIEPASKSCDLGNLHVYSICLKSRFLKVSKPTKPFKKPVWLKSRSRPQTEDANQFELCYAPFTRFKLTCGGTLVAKLKLRQQEPILGWQLFLFSGLTSY